MSKSLEIYRSAHHMLQIFHPIIADDSILSNIRQYSMNSVFPTQLLRIQHLAALDHVSPQYQNPKQKQHSILISLYMFG